MYKKKISRNDLLDRIKKYNEKRNCFRGYSRLNKDDLMRFFKSHGATRIIKDIPRKRGMREMKERIIPVMSRTIPRTYEKVHIPEFKPYVFEEEKKKEEEDKRYEREYKNPEFYEEGKEPERRPEDECITLLNKKVAGDKTFDQVVREFINKKIQKGELVKYSQIGTFIDRYLEVHHKGIFQKCKNIIYNYYQQMNPNNFE